MRTLVIGNKNYSTWSFRAWWVMKHAGLEFDECRVPLYVDGYREELLTYAPTGMVPVLIEDGVAIWDSLAICETVAENRPTLWPLDRETRARARALCAEMHSGFRAIRGALHMNCRAIGRKVPPAEEIDDELRRVKSIVEECRAKHQHAGPWLFGSFSIADAMYAPLLFSTATYRLDCGLVVARYIETLMQDPFVKAWFEAAREENETIDRCETGL